MHSNFRLGSVLREFYLRVKFTLRIIIRRLKMSWRCFCFVLQSAKKYLIISANYMAIRISLNNCFRITVISVIFNKTRNFSKKISRKGRAKEFSDVDPRALAKDKELSGNGGITFAYICTYLSGVRQVEREALHLHFHGRVPAAGPQRERITSRRRERNARARG